MSLQLIKIASSTPFLQNLFYSTSTYPTHISDFRNQPRTDSRAEKSQRLQLDTDFSSTESTTVSAQLTGSERRAGLLGKVIGNSRRSYERIVNNLQEYQSKQLSNADENASTPSKSMSIKKHFSTLLTAIGLNKLQQNRDPEYLNKYLASPSAPIYASPTASSPFHLLDLWRNRAAESERKFNAKVMSYTDTDDAPVTTLQPIPGETFANYSNTDQIPTNNNHLNDNHNNNTRIYTQTTASAGGGAAAADVVNAPFQLYGNPKTRAKLAFQNAFYKYSNSVSNRNSNKMIQHSNTAPAAVDDDNGATNEARMSSPVVEGIPLGNNDYLNAKTMDVAVQVGNAAGASVANGAIRYLILRRIDERQQQQQHAVDSDGDEDNVNDIVDKIGDSSDGNDTDANANIETIGIFILEIIGSVAGLTWGAFSQIQNSLFANN